MGWFSFCCCCCSVVSDSFVTPWTIACQAPLSMGFPRQEYQSRLPFPSARDLPQPRDWTRIFCIAGGFFTTELPGKPLSWLSGLPVDWFTIYSYYMCVCVYFLFYIESHSTFSCAVLSTQSSHPYSTAKHTFNLQNSASEQWLLWGLLRPPCLL